MKKKDIVIGGYSLNSEVIGMKILHINSYYSNSLFYKNLFENQIKKGLDIDVFVPVHKHFIKNDFEYGDYTTISRNHGKYDRFIFYLKHHKIYKDITKKFNIKESQNLIVIFLNNKLIFVGDGYYDNEYLTNV